MEIFEAFLAKVDDPGHRARTEEVLEWVAKTFPQLQPKVAWNQPMFTDHETFIIGFSTAKAHLAAAPERVVVARFSDAIKEAGCDHTQELIRIRWDKPVPYGLLQQIIAFNIKDKADCQTFWRK